MFLNPTTFLALAASSVSALALHASPPELLATRQSGITWSVSNFGSGCSPGGCSARFQVSAPANYYIVSPAFNVTCQSYILGPNNWRECTNPGEGHDDSVSVYAYVQWGGYDYFDIWVYHTYVALGRTFNNTGNHLLRRFGKWEPFQIEVVPQAIID